MSGVSIGDKFIVEAQSAVIHNFDSNIVVAGVPARRLRSISDYLIKTDPTQLYEPDYEYAKLNDISTRHILRFREKVYRAMGFQPYKAIKC